MSRLFLALAATGLMALPAVADDLRDAAEAVTACRALPDADKAACFDTTSAALADLLAPAIVAAAPEDSAPEWAKAPEPKEPEGCCVPARPAHNCKDQEAHDGQSGHPVPEPQQILQG